MICTFIIFWIYLRKTSIDFVPHPQTPLELHHLAVAAISGPFDLLVFYQIDFHILCSHSY